MFERFTDSARLVIVNAQRRFGSLNHTWIGTEHILLGVMGEDHVVVQLLDAAGVDTDAVREQIKQALGVGLTQLGADVDGLVQEVRPN